MRSGSDGSDRCRSLSRDHSATASAKPSGISDRRAMRARMSSDRLVSWVEVASRVPGQWRAMESLSAWNSSGLIPNRPGSPPTSLRATSRL